MCNICVINKHHGNIPSGAINIMRGSPLGNPFTVLEYGRPKAISNYEHWIRMKIQEGDQEIIDALDEIAARAMDGETVYLLCCCSPMACHGEVIIKIVLEAINKARPQLIYAGIGSRGTPIDVQAGMVDIGRQLAQSGWLLRSGYAQGADQAFHEGAIEGGGQVENFIPWAGFNKAPHGPMFIVPELTTQMLQLAAKHHPNWMACKEGAQKLHARNGCQILGEHLNHPVKMVICWTQNGMGQGGTGQAIRIAKAHNIPVFDLALTAKWKQLCDFVEQTENQQKKAA